MRSLRRHKPVVPHVEVLDLRPGDRLVVETPERITHAQAADIRAHMAKAAGVDVTRVIVVSNMSVKVLREGDPPPPPPVIVSPGVS